MKIINEYGTHHYEEEWSKSDYHCPICGLKEIWTEDSDGDFYIGSESICTGCGSVLYLDHCGESGSGSLTIADQLRNGKTAVSTSKKL